jgi:hypothetical protein
MARSNLGTGNVSIQKLIILIHGGNIAWRELWWGGEVEYSCNQPPPEMCYIIAGAWKRTF